jgi:outer membrane receptor for ferrienterochelin and colicin
MLKKTIIFIILTLPIFSFAQQKISGRVMEIVGTKEVSIPGASVYLIESQQGIFTDSAGFFTLETSQKLPINIAISFPGYYSDTILVNSFSPVKTYLKKSVELKEVEVAAKKEAISISTINPLNSEKITQRELLKAACCNISEAFETNPSVTVDYKDAVTGIKEIQLLGLGGIYAQMLSENIPEMRGLAGIYGLTYIPGPWIESIQLTKGAGSVLNGYESTTGQINVEYKKPNSDETPRFYLNLFGEESGGAEANLFYKRRINNQWSSILMLHGRSMQNEMDRNDDNFMDSPKNKNFNIYSRWQYHSNKKLEGQVSLKFLTDDVKGGQVNEIPVANRYSTNVKTYRAEVNGKLGFVFPEKPAKSIGNIFQFTLHDMKSNFGPKVYDGREGSFYYQGIYQNVLSNNNQEYKLGVSYRYDRLEQNFPGLPKVMEENIPGVFLEYTYKYFEKLTVVAGVREDLQENNKLVFTPRLHAKYNFTENLIFRMSGGRSYRKPFLMADNLSVLASSRQIVFKEDILAERAWNYGTNLTLRGKLGHREYSLSADAYRTEFSDQLVVDAYSDSSKISFYNLNGSSYSNSFQITLNAEIIERLDLRLGYKMEDVRSTFNGKLEQKPLISKDRYLATLSYRTSNEHWKFDYTIVYEGKKKLQNVFFDAENGNNNFSPSFTLMNFQITKVFRKFELYGGTENLTDFRQLHPIIHPENPLGNSFDATNIWGPIQGRRIYLGFRMSII